MQKNRLYWQSLIIFMGLSYSFSPLLATPVPDTMQLEVPAKEISRLTLPSVNRGVPKTQNNSHRCGGNSKGVNFFFRSILPNGDVEGIGVNGKTFSTSLAIANTVSSAPTLWWYIPSTEQGVQIEFYVYLANDLVYTQRLNDIKGKSGLLQIKLPENTIKSEQPYFWWLSIHREGYERSGEPWLSGYLYHHNIDAIRIRNEPELVDVLKSTLMDDNSFLSLGETESRQELADEVDANFSEVETRLREHYINLQSNYVTLNYLIQNLEQNQNISLSELPELKTKYSQIVLELAQLSAFFDMWANTVNLLANHRAEHPDEWTDLLSRILPVSDPEIRGFDAAEMLNVLSTSENFGENSTKVRSAGTKCFR